MKVAFTAWQKDIVLQVENHDFAVFFPSSFFAAYAGSLPSFLAFTIAVEYFAAAISIKYATNRWHGVNA